MNSTLLPFHQQLGNAWKLFLHRWGVAAILQALMVIPGILMLPLVTEYLAATSQGIDSSIVFEETIYGTQFLIGFILLLLLGVFTSAAMGILFSSKEKLSFFAVITATSMRYIPVLYSSILAGLAVAVSLIPALGLNYWYSLFARSGIEISASGIVAIDAIVLIAIVALLIPAAIVAVWVMYAPLVTAIKAAPAGFTALMFAKNRVHGHLWQVLWRIIGSLVLFQIVSVSVSMLPYASYLVPFALMIITTAFFVELYKELNNGEL
jgi:hypothetical protein